MTSRIEDAIRASIANASRLVDDAELLEFSDPPATAYFLTVIAQEELAKGFLLALAHAQVIPWDQRLLRATRDHKCKHLVGIVMDYLAPNLDEFLHRCDAVVLRHEKRVFPSKVADAMNILRHEKLGRWESQSWVWAKDPEYDSEALAVSEGKMDQIKQDALYVRLGRDGGVVSTPSDYTRQGVRIEIERSRRFVALIENLLEGQAHPGLDYDLVSEGFKTLFVSDDLLDPAAS